MTKKDDLKRRLGIAQQVFHHRAVRAGLLEQRISDLWDLIRKEEQEFIEATDRAREALETMRLVGRELEDLSKEK